MSGDPHNPASDESVEVPRAPLGHRIVGRCFAVLIACICYAPKWVSYGFANLLTPGFVLFTFCGRKRAYRKRRGFYHNTEIVFRGRLSTRQRRRLLWSWARHMMYLGIDVARMPRITAATVQACFDLSELARLREAVADDKGALLVSGHIGVYEYSPHLLSLLGLTVHTIYRESPIPPITDVLNRLRSKGGQVMVLRQGAVRQLLRLMAARKFAGILSDVSAKNSELFVPFLGTDAATNNIAGMLHLKTGAPIIVLSLQRTRHPGFKLHVWDVIRQPKSDDRNSDLRAIAERINDSLSRAICTYPEQWFWDSRRFRTRPEGEVRDAEDMPLQTKPEQVTACLE